MTARLPPSALADLDPGWSRLVTAPDHRGVPVTWHVLDTRPEGASRTLLCVHGNPSWSYLFRRLCASAPADVRVVAVDQLDMGFSERTGVVRRLADRIADLDAVTDELGIDGPVITVAHDWGGPVSLGWALAHLHHLTGIVLMNTAVHQPDDAQAPGLIRLARSRAVLPNVAVRTDAFVRGAMALSRRRYERGVEEAFLAPYRTADRRRAIGEFVADIPLEHDHPTAPTLDAIADGLPALRNTPALLLWGAQDPVFNDLYLHDLEHRLPHAQVHRYPRATHFVSEDVDVSTALWDWVGDQSDPDTDPTVDVPHEVEQLDGATMTAPLLAPDDPVALAVAELDGSTVRSIGYGDLHDRGRLIGASLRRIGVAPADRVAVMVPPGIDLSACVLGCWHAGASVVLVDGALTPAQMNAAIRSAAPDHLIGIDRALRASRLLRWRVNRIALDAEHGVRAVPDRSTAASDARSAPTAPAVDPTTNAHAEAAVVFTSGSTGPSKGVRYTHGPLIAQRSAVQQHYGIGPDDRLVAAFAPFALFGPVLGIACAVPDMDVSAPGTLTAGALADAVDAVGATLVFASPAALVNVVATAGDLTNDQRAAFGSVRMLLSAGAPVRSAVLRATAALLGAERAHTPYGMTECLPVADIELREIEAATGGDGVCVGRPLRGVEVLIRPLGDLGEPIADLTAQPGVLGEIVVRAEHLRTGYDRLWHTEHLASQPPGWHATGDVGSFDTEGRLWVGGRRQHLITSESGLIASVGAEHRIAELDDIELAAVVGVGPVGAQQAVAVCRRANTRRSRVVVGPKADAVRAAAGIDLVAVIDVPSLPVDRRHNSKIDRTRVADWAGRVLAGRGLGVRGRWRP